MLSQTHYLDISYIFITCIYYIYLIDKQEKQKIPPVTLYINLLTKY